MTDPQRDITYILHWGDLASTVRMLAVAKTIRDTYRRDRIDAPPVEDTFVINIGDLMEVLTNGIYTATLHRVVNTHGLRRYSYPFFIDSDYDALIEPIDGLADAGDRPKGRSVTCGDHKFAKYVATFPHLQDAAAD